MIRDCIRAALADPRQLLRDTLGLLVIGVMLVALLIVGAS